ncbi:uncharacterized protein I206_100027 [Kwoniella pini CBS 10737]|uniref:BZIP domain-containing protein n=1 Tax=Kwoniella pini CBS 10737 TaxID=1296096 RepID=A0A1B9HSC0_9TREE|nr:uncharacterized protein I206_07842 [Kwoniella pini CBS 10737]OCF46172.1 hypothetical protein I206_07842 [Kwoniella pini CBS 10737]
MVSQILQCARQKQQLQQQQQAQQQLRTCQARCPSRPLPNSLTYHSQDDTSPLQGIKTPAFTPLPTRLPPPPIITRRHDPARASSQSKASLNVQQEKTNNFSALRQPSLPATTQEYQIQVQVQPTEPNFALNLPTDIVNNTTDIFNNIPSFENTLFLATNSQVESTTSMEFNLDINMSNMESIDWDQFLVDSDLGEAQAAQPMTNSNANSPAPSDSQTATPKSTESEQSAALDPETDFDFNFEFDLPLGITHRPEDIFNPVQPFDFTASVPDTRGTNDPTMTNTFGLSFGDFGLHTDLGADAASQLGLTNLIGKLGDKKMAQQPSNISTMAPVNDLTDAYALLDKLLPTASSPMSIQPSQLSLPPSPPLTGIKRKSSDASEDGAPAAKKRGRPPGSAKTKTLSLQDPKRLYQRQSTVFSGSPTYSANSVADESEIDSPMATSPITPAAPKKTASGKPSTARPKSVVPEKFLKDGSAQAILGMTIDQIQSYPSFDMLLKDVEASKLPTARDFGERISDNRDKAKDAAKKSRDERRAKIERSEYLEKKVDDLESKLKGMTSVLLTLVDRGIINKDQIASFL